MTARECLSADLERYYVHLPAPKSRSQRLWAVLTIEGIWALILFRFGQYVSNEAPRGVRTLLVVVHRLATRVLQCMVGIHIFPGAQIGPGFYIGHSGNIWISPKARMGAKCSVAQGVTIGFGGMIRQGWPTIGDRVWIGPNATVAGPVLVGNGAVVAANSLVVSNVPEKAVVVGVPAQIVSYSGSGSLLALPQD